MISTMSKKYCRGNIKDIENYDKAALDPVYAWKVYHRNLITGVGRITPKSLDSIGKYYKVPASELIFLPRSEVDRIEEDVPMSNEDMHRINKVLKFWIRLNPDRLFSELTQQEYDRLDRSISRLRILWNQMKARCHNEKAQDYRFYGALGVKVCDEWLESSDSFVLWSLQNGYTYYPDRVKGDQLSIDRIDPTKGYEPSNCRWIPHRENCSRTRPIDWTPVIDRAYKLARLFPLAVVEICYGRPRMDWKKARDTYFGGDNKKVVQFLEENGFCSMSIYKVRKTLGDVVPQRKSERGE